VRKQHRCPKCLHTRILHVPEPKDVDHDRMALGAVMSVWTGGVNGGLEAYVCLGCGYTELYVADLDEMDISKIDGARLLGPPESEDPYR
jgi:predicted nucleic-acid-binding Zn-ribbon protein